MAVGQDDDPRGDDRLAIRVTYMPDPKLEQLLEDWEDLRQEGREVSAEELCRDCPEL